MAGSDTFQWRIQDLRLRGPTFFRNYICTPPPLRGFPEATIKVYTWIFFSETTIKVYTWIFRISNFFFLWSHYKSVYLDFLGFPKATIKIYTWISWDFELHPPLVFFFSEATIKVYTWIFFWSHYKSLYLNFLKGGGGGSPPPPGSAPAFLCSYGARCQWDILSLIFFLNILSVIPKSSVGWREILIRPRPSVSQSICLSITFPFRTVARRRIAVSTINFTVMAPGCGVCGIVFHLDGLLSDFLKNFCKIEKNLLYILCVTIRFTYLGCGFTRFFHSCILLIRYEVFSYFKIWVIVSFHF